MGGHAQTSGESLCSLEQACTVDKSSRELREAEAARPPDKLGRARRSQQTQALS